MTITADRLLNGVKRRIIMPASQTTLTDGDILAFADDVIATKIVTLMESVQQEYFVTSTLVPLVAGQNEYSIPYRAVGRALRDIKMIDANNNVRNLAKIALEDVQIYQQQSLTCGFYFKSDKFHLVPDVPETITPNLVLEVWYRLAPSSLVPSSLAMKVVSVSAPNVVVESVPTDYIVGSVIDFVQGRSGSSIYSMDKTIQNINGTTITFDADVVPTDLMAGDYISLAQTSPVINFVPNEVYSLVESYTAARALSSIGDFDGLQIVRADIDSEEKSVKMLLEPRIDGEPTIIINRNGLVRGNKFSQRSWLYGQ